VTPILARTRAGLAAARSAIRQPLALVPVADAVDGAHPALDDGHRVLIRAARRHAGPSGSVVVAVVVGGPWAGGTAAPDSGPGPGGGERAAERDFALCAAEDVDLMFVPRPDQLIGAPGRVTVDPGPAGRMFEGSGGRPGLGGYLTVMLRLFSLIGPEAAVVCDRDAQRLFLVRQMVADLDLPVTVVAAAAARDPDGLPVSGPSARLSAAERATALALTRALRAGQQAAAGGAPAALDRARAELDAAAAGRPPLVTDYLAVVDPATFEPVRAGFGGPAIMLVAGAVGGIRLIDSAWLTVGYRPGEGRRRAAPATARGESG
jgi:pantoate--beta-alanine ligase